MLNVFLALVMMCVLCLLVVGIGFFVVWVGWNILLVIAFLLIFAGCYDFVDHMRNG